MFSSLLRTPLAVLVAYVAVVSTAPATSSAPSLTVKTSIPDLDVDGLKNLEVTATIINTGGVTIKLLNDPRGVLDPFPEDSFIITDPSGSRLPFRGARASYNPTYPAGIDDPNAFTVLDPGDSINVTHNLSSAYDFTHSGAGDYSVEPSNLFTYVDGGGTPKVLHATVEGIAKVRLSGGLGVSQHIHDNRGAFIGCKDTDRQRIEAAVVVLRESLEDARDYMNGIEGPTLRYETWFGTYDAVNKNVVQGILGTVSAERLHKDMRYRCLAKCSNPYTLAYAGPNNARDMFICPPFHKASGMVRILVLIRQLAHIYGGANHEYGYGAKISKKIAAEDPGLATQLAENYAFFVQNLGHLE